MLDPLTEEGRATEVLNPFVGGGRSNGGASSLEGGAKEVLFPSVVLFSMTEEESFFLVRVRSRWSNRGF